MSEQMRVHVIAPGWVGRFVLSAEHLPELSEWLRERLPLPPVICPACNGAGCSSCANGVLPRWQRDEASKGGM